MRFLSVFVCICAMLAQGCSSDDSPTVSCNPAPVAQQDPEINDYITQNGLTMQTTATGLRYSIDIAGSGDNIMFGDAIELNFQGAFLDGTIFDQGTIGPAVINQGSFIPGFEEGLLLLNEGAQATLILPGILAYGCFPPPNSGIGDNQILIFEVTVVSINP